MLKRYPIALNTWVAVAVGAFVLALSAFLVLSHNSPDSVSAQATPAPGLIQYAENGEGPVRVFTSEDPEGAGVHWDVTGTDADDFSISGGVLTFNKPPNFESPTDRPHGILDFNGDTDTADPGESAATTEADRMYQITIRASEMRSGSGGLALSTEAHFTVEVTDVNEPGVVTIDRIQPEVGTTLTASVSDPDGTTGTTDTPTTVAWQWYYSSVTNPVASSERHWRAISGATDPAYIPSGDRVGDATDSTPDTAGKYLRAVATYTDSLGTERTTPGVTDNPVRPEVASTSDTGVSNPANGSPGFTQGVDYSRTVSESLGRGMNVGAPVVATDPQNDVLTYFLDDDDDATNGLGTTGDVGLFSINKATGQLMVAKSLDYDNNADRRYRFYVRAYDPSGEDAQVQVTVNVTDANDAPEIKGNKPSTAGPTDPTPDAPSELRVNEQDSDKGADPYDGAPGMPIGYELGSTTINSPNVFTAPDEDDRGQITWTLEGDDKDQFVLTQANLSGSDEPVAVVFQSPPDYENPTDANGDSVYKVTLVATDSTSLPGSSALRDERPLTVFVDNVHELGKVTMKAGGANEDQPHIGEAVTAEVTDPDGGVAVVTWQWSRAGYVESGTQVADTDATTYEVIPGATSSSYTPRTLRNSRGVITYDDDGATLRVTATYIDVTSDVDDPDSATVDERVQGTGPVAKVADTGDGSAAGATRLYRVMATSENAVRVAPGDPSATDDPVFEMASYDRTVAENAETNTLVGEPVTVNPERNVTFNYNLDATVTNANAYFTIDNHGQIRVGEVPFPDPLPAGVEAIPTGADPADGPVMDDPTLDYEGTSNTFSLIVTATDASDSSRTATAGVTVTLDDLNERPYFDMVSRAAGGTATDPLTYIETRTNAVVELEAVEPDGDTLRWETAGADGPDFEVRQLSDIPGSGKDRVALYFKSQPDFENGKGSGDFDDDGTSSPIEYEVTVRAIETTAVGGGPNLAAELMVFVTVQNGDEDGTVDISLLQPEVGTGLTASVSDPDGGVTGATWTWYRSKTVNPVQDETDTTDSTFVASWEAITGAPTDGTYTPAVDDVGRYLLARVAYGDTQDTTADAKAAVARTGERARADVADDANNSPDFRNAETTRTIPENAAVGTNVGRPVIVDVNEDNDVLTYVLDNDAIVTGDVDTTGDVGFFSINKRTGQITVAKKLDFDQKPEHPEPADGKYVFWVRAWDSSGESTGDENNDHIEVTVTATDVNDAPKITGGAAEISINEVDSSKKSSDVTRFVGLGKRLNTAGDAQEDDPDNPNLYRRTDEDRVDSGRWPDQPIGGPDGSLFEYSVPTGEADIGRRLHFKRTNLPDYENPMDSNRDNVYEVTVRVLDNDGAAGTKNVRITVMNVDEAGKLVLTPEQPDAGMPVVATLTDPDGVTSITNWRWAIADGTVADFAAAVALDDTIDDDGLGEVAGATMSQYMADEGKFVWAEVDYRDGASAVNHPVTALDERNDDPDTDPTPIETAFDSDETLEKVTDNAVEPDPDTTTGPDAPSADIIEVERMVYENVPSTGYVGIPLDPNAHIDYRANGGTASRDTIAGPDAATFVFAEEQDDSGDTFYDTTLAPTDDDLTDKKGQLAAAVVTHFDRETKPQYIIEVRDPDAQVTVGAVRVTINVMDVNEAPSAPEQLRAALTVTGTQRFEIGEVIDPAGAMPEVGTFNTLGADAASSTWTLAGADMDDFTITPGPGSMATVTFAALPDFENEADADTDNVYNITVTANDGSNTATRDVTVTVTNMKEEGTVSLDMATPRVGEAVTAEVSDPDMVDMATVTWQWAVEDAANGGDYMDIAGATTASYTPVADDVGKKVRATASYTDGFGADEAVKASTNPVAAGGIPGDTDGDDSISTTEMLAAIGLYFQDPPGLTLMEMLEIIGAYFSGS